MEDLELLVEHFAAEIAGESALGKKKIDPRIYRILQAYAWPGNIRELRNFIERLIIMTPGNVIGPEDLPADFRNGLREENGDSSWLRCETMEEARTCFERDFLLKRLEENGWNISLTAARIGLERTHLHKKMKALGIKKEG
jgi:two-component system nitrogen regulation response regulator NtrX